MHEAGHIVQVDKPQLRIFDIKKWRQLTIFPRVR